MRNPTHRKPKPAPVFGVPAATILISLVCGMVGGDVFPSSRPTGFILLTVAAGGFCMATFLYRRDDS